MFDHTLIVAEDDPHLSEFHRLSDLGLVDIRVMPQVGCEATAEFVFAHVEHFVAEQTSGRVWLDSVEVREHGANAAIYERSYSGSGSLVESHSGDSLKE
jgi:6-pyruvoyltetrahydropterin/6-carboxytetrahydropterin synthase